MSARENRTMRVPVTQYVRPHGERREGGFCTTPDVYAMAEEVIAKGYRFEAEVLPNGLVYVDVCGPNEEGDDDTVANLLSEDGPALLEQFDDLIRRAYAVLRKAA